MALAAAAALSVRAQERLSLRNAHPTRRTRSAAEVPLADLHADSLLWGRDLLTRSEAGQVDLPRLAQARVALQVFSVVTRIPEPFRMHGNSTKSDGLWPLALLESWPVPALFDAKARAMHLAALLREDAARAPRALRLLRTREDVARLIRDRAGDPQLVGAVLSLEGSYPVEGELANLGPLFDAGFRMIGLTHFQDAAAAGSAHGVSGEGLTDFGRKLVRELERRQITIDLAHASAETIADVTALATRPVIVSHTGVSATCDSPRNLSDAQPRAVARTGGLVGIGYWAVAVCGHDTAAIARAVRHAVDVIGADHVALGSDFDGAVSMPFDVTGVPDVLEALRKAGLTDAQIRRIAGQNVIDFFAAQLPSAHRAGSP